MKKLFIICSLILAAAFFTSCEKETIFLPENESDQSIRKEKLSAITPLDIPAVDLYALAPWIPIDNIALYNYNPTTDEIVLNEGFGSTEFDFNYGFDFNNEDGLIYLLAGTISSRYLYTWDKFTNETALIEQIISVGGDYYPQDLTFGNDGTLYFAFKNGEINSYNVTTNLMSAFSTIPDSTIPEGLDEHGSVGLTYNFDNNQLIFAQSNGPVQLFSIDVSTGNVIALFDFYNDSGTGQAIEYIGNDKLIGSGTFGYNTIFTVDLVTQEFNVLLYPTGSYESIKDLMFIIPNSDIDGDGVPNIDDNCPYTLNADQLDTDADGKGDVCDNCPDTPNSDQANNDHDSEGDVCDTDDDNDGIPDAADNCPLTSNSDQANNDGDSEGDVCDTDDDNDGVYDVTDNCPTTENADQTDNDGDTIGDVCDDDDDNDSIPDNEDNCYLTANSDQTDTDYDGLGDVCDNCPDTSNADQADTDADGVGDVCDNCPESPNEDQADNDSDSQGDVCDTDDDNDGIPDNEDNCYLISNINQANNDDDIVGDVCDDDDDNDGCLDTEDLFDFSNFETTVNIEGCDTGVTNRATGVCGIMMSDRIDELEGGTYNKKVTFIKAVTKLTTEWQRAGLITTAEKNLILKCARKASY